MQRREARSVQRSRNVQRQSLAQAGLTGGLTENGTASVVGAATPLDVKKYKITVPETQADRTAALQKASEKNAELGVRLNATRPDGTCVVTKSAASFEKSTIKETLDPFVLEVEVPFTKDGATHTLTCEYQHARQFSGYVSKVKVWAVDFVALYRQWDVTFAKAYNIAGATVATKLRANKVDRQVAIDKTALTVKDYDLDTGAGFVPVI